MNKSHNIIMSIALNAISLVLIAGCTDKAHRWRHKNTEEYITKALTLDVNQEILVNDIVQQINRKNKELCSNIDVITDEVKKQIQSDVFDVEVLNKLISDELDKTETTINYIVEQVADFHSLLDDDQKKRLQYFLDEWDSKKHKRSHFDLCNGANG